MEFKKYTVEELVKLNMLEKPMDGNHGGKHPTSKDYVKSGIPFIMVSDINNGKINYNTCKYISKSTRDKLDKGFSKPNDVLLSHKATIGLTAIVGTEFDEIVLTPQLTYYRVKNNINNKYLKYYFDSLYFQNILNNWATSGSTRAYLGITAQLKLPILLPDIVTQNKVAKILSDIDKKIELNNQINDNLLDLIKTLYSEKIKNNYSDNFEEKTLDEFCNIFTGKKNANASKDDGKYKFFTCAPEPLYINSYIYDGPAIIVAGNGAYTGRTTFYNGKFDLYQRTYGITAFDNNDYIYLLYAMVYTDLQNEIMGGTHGSAIPYIVFNDIAKFKVRYNAKIFNELSNTMKSFLIKIKNNELESEALTQLRNTLLPKLMNGEIDLDKVEM